MRALFSEYGKTILYVLIGGAMLSLTFFLIQEEYRSSNTPDYSVVENVKDIASVKTPVIELVNNNLHISGSIPSLDELKTSTYVNAKYSDGSTVPSNNIIIIGSIEDIAGLQQITYRVEEPVKDNTGAVIRTMSIEKKMNIIVD